MQTILGSTGIIGTELAKELYRDFTKEIRLVSRNPEKVHESDELFPADLTDPQQTQLAVKGSDVVYLTVGLPYRSAVWEEKFPVIMENTIMACQRHKAKLVFFDNTYMYGATFQLITEDQPYNPTGRKSKVRSQIAKRLLREMERATIEAVIARAPEFYGPGKTNSVTNSLIFDNLKKEKQPKVLLKADTLRTLIFTPDAARATALLGNNPDTFGETWHLPCDDNRLTSAQFIAEAEKFLDTSCGYGILHTWMIKLAAFFNKDISETIELLPRYKIDNLFDSSKFKRRFPDFQVTNYSNGIMAVIDEIKEEKR